jgi:hypothetical protein
LCHHQRAGHGVGDVEHPGGMDGCEHVLGQMLNSWLVLVSGHGMA